MTGLQSRFVATACLALLALYGHAIRVRADEGTGDVKAQVAWEENFDAPEGPALGQFYYEDRGSGKSGEGVVIREVARGAFKYGLKFDPDRKQDRLNLMFGDCAWGKPRKTKWGPFDVEKFPILEIKWRGTSFALWVGTADASGKRRSDYSYLKPHRKETDAQGREWNVSVFRPAPGQTKLLGINPALYSPSQEDAVTQIDQIRVRGFTPEERAAEAKRTAVLADFPQGRWRGFDDFFPHGVYFVGYLRNDFESWGGDFEGAYGTYARRHINYACVNDEIELGRMGAGALATKEWPKVVDAYIDAMREQVHAARSTGIRLGADVRRMMDGRDPGNGYQQLLPITDRLVKAFPNDDTIISWVVADEPGTERLVTLVSIIRALRESDPLKRPEFLVFNAPVKMEPYAPYIGLNSWDRYPVHAGRRDPWSIRDAARQYRELLPDKPMWVTLPSFETRPPTPKGSYTRPTDAEMRMMAYMTLAEGAKGLIWYMGWNGSGRDEGLVDRTGLPRGGMLDTISDLGERLIPIGTQLLAADAAPDAKIEVTTLPPKPACEHKVVVSALAHRDKPVHFLVVVNEDLCHTRSAKVTLARDVLPDGQRVYDLYSLDGADLLETEARFTVSPLAGGDGRIYAACSEDNYERIRTEILCAKALEALRVLTPDITIARRWGLDLDHVDEAIETCKAAAGAGDVEEALAKAARAKALLAQRIENDSQLAAVRRALRDIQLELAEVSRITEHRSLKPTWWTGRGHPMMVPNPGFLELSKRYFEVGRSYRDLYTAYLKGEREGLWTKLNKTRLDCLAMREDVLTFLREKLKPENEPAK